MAELEMIKSLRLSLVIIVALALFIGVNMLAKSKLHQRYDFTQERLFTISPETTKLLKQLKEPLHIRLFFTSKLAQGLPVFGSYHDRVVNILRHYEALSAGKITLELIEPEPFSEQEDLAVAHGIEGVAIDEAGLKFYFGASVENSTDERKVIPFFDPEKAQFLEYDLTKTLTDIAKNQRKKIGIISNLPVSGGADFKMTASLNAPTPKWAIITQIEEQFTVRNIPKEAEFIEDDIDILLLIHPHHFSTKTYYAVEQFLLRGGKALIFMDSSVNLSAQEFITSDFERLLNHWGVKFSGNMVAAEKATAMNVQSLSASSRLESYPKITWLELGAQNMAKDSVITEPLQRVRMIESGFFAPTKTMKLQFRPLISTGEEAAAIKVDINAKDNAVESVKLFNDFLPQGKKLHLAAQLSGEIEALIDWNELDFKNDEIKQLLKQRHIAKSKQPINVILVGDTDMLRNEFWARIQQLFGQQVIVPEADNSAFVLNSLELLSGDNLLINLRSRGNEVRRFVLLDELQKKAKEQFQAEENILKERLKQMEQRLMKLQSQRQNNGELFNEDQVKEIASFKQLFLNARKELRAVQHNLNNEITTLGNKIAFANILIAPLIMMLMAVIFPPFLRNFRLKKTLQHKSLNRKNNNIEKS